jgi:hypothetical protein
VIHAILEVILAAAIDARSFRSSRTSIYGWRGTKSLSGRHWADNRHGSPTPYPQADTASGFHAQMPRDPFPKAAKIAPVRVHAACRDIKKIVSNYGVRVYAVTTSYGMSVIGHNARFSRQVARLGTCSAKCPFCSTPARFLGISCHPCRNLPMN